MRVCFDAGSDAQEHLGAGIELLESVEFVEAVDDNAADADFDGAGQLGVGLVVAVEHHAVWGDPGIEGDVQLAPGGDVDSHAFFVHETGHGRAQERL
jgi:hypothetical protein